MESKKGILIRVACIVGLLGIVLLISWLKEGKKEGADNFLEDTVWTISSDHAGIRGKSYTFSFGENQIEIENSEAAGCVQSAGTYRLIDDKKIQFDFDLVPEEFDIKKHCIAEYIWSEDDNGGNILQISFEEEEWRLSLTQNIKAQKDIADGCWTGVEGTYKGYVLFYRNGNLYVIDEGKDTVVKGVKIDFKYDKASAYDRSGDIVYEDIAFTFDEDTLTLETGTEKTVFQRGDAAAAQRILDAALENKNLLAGKIKSGFWTAEINGETYCFCTNQNGFYLLYNETRGYLVDSGDIWVDISQKIFTDKYHTYAGDKKKYVVNDMKVSGDDILLENSTIEIQESEKADSRNDMEGEILIPQTLFKKEEVNRFEAAQQDAGTVLLPYWAETYQCGDMELKFSERNGLKAVLVSSINEVSGYGYFMGKNENGYQVLWINNVRALSDTYQEETGYPGMAVITVNESGISFAQDGNTYEFISESEE